MITAAPLLVTTSSAVPHSVLRHFVGGEAGFEASDFLRLCFGGEDEGRLHPDKPLDDVYERMKGVLRQGGQQQSRTADTCREPHFCWFLRSLSAAR